MTLHLETARSEDALAIPASAVVEEDARPIAFGAAGTTEAGPLREFILSLADEATPPDIRRKSLKAAA